MKKLLAFAGTALAGVAAFADYSGYNDSTLPTIFGTESAKFVTDVQTIVSDAMPVVLSIAGAALALVLISLIWRAVTRFLGRK